MTVRKFKTAMIGLAIALCTLCISMAVTPNAQAAETKGAASIKQGTQKGQATVQNLQKNIKETRNKRLKEVLKLNDTQSNKLLTMINKHNEEKQASLQKRVKLMGEVREALKNRITDKKAAAILKKMKKNRADLFKMQKNQKNQIETLLSPSQTLSYLVIERRYNQEMKWLDGMVRQAMRQKGQATPAAGK